MYDLKNKLHTYIHFRLTRKKANGTVGTGNVIVKERLGFAVPGILFYFFYIYEKFIYDLTLRMGQGNTLLFINKRLFFHESIFDHKPNYFIR